MGGKLKKKNSLKGGPLKSACTNSSKSPVSQEPLKKKNLKKFFSFRVSRRAMVIFTYFEDSELALQTANEQYVNF